MKPKESLIGKYISLIISIPFTIAFLYVWFAFAISHPVWFIISLPFALAFMGSYMKSEVKKDDDWLDKYFAFSLGLFGSFLALAWCFWIVDCIQSCFKSNNNLEISNIQYEKCLRKHPYNKKYCEYLK